MNALLNYPGAKWGMAEEIVALMPSHRSYLEPFFGSGAVLFNKPPSAIETVNDIDGDVVNFFTVLREHPEELAQRVYLTPYSRDVFDDSYNDWGTDPIDRAHQFVIRSKMSHGFKMHHKSGFKIDVQGREKAYCVESWNRIPDNLTKAAIRLKDVQIENRPALDLIRRFNYENVLIYADPPYLMETRCCAQYRHEMTEQDHIDLLAALLQHKGPVILSGYPSELYDRELKCWSRITRKSYNQNADQRTEVLWCNFEVGQISLFDTPETAEQSCLVDGTQLCRFAPCTEAQGVRCCGHCPFRKTCTSGCEKFERRH